ncbi:FAD-dependent oxidoreductase [Patescibacteria group bacterium]|nr:FAD-dependent oxidoreductase [Patescibacteria group bacterium]
MAVKELYSSLEFKDLIKSESKVVLDFYSDDCPPCEKLAPIYEQLSEIYPELVFVKMFRQKNKELAEEFNINSSPSLVFFAEGKILDKRLSGYINKEDLINLIEEHFPNLEKKEFAALNQESQNADLYDLCIVGNGPAGLTASIYASRYNIKHLVVGDLPGGLMTSSHKICNFPSYEEISGMDLSEKMFKHANSLGGEQKLATVKMINDNQGIFNLTLSDNSEIKAKTILLTTGTKHKHLGLDREEFFLGRGVSYCATCDAMFYKDKVVAVIGGGDSANTASLYLAEVATKVYQIYRGEKLKGEPAWVDQIKVNNKIEVIYNTNVVELIGEDKLSGIKIKDSEKEKSLVVDGLFIEIGSQPELSLIEALDLETDEGSYIKVSSSQKTNRQRVWAAGDITNASDNFRQIITACSEGAIAAQSIFQYLQGSK